MVLISSVCLSIAPPSSTSSVASGTLCRTRLLLFLSLGILDFSRESDYSLDTGNILPLIKTERRRARRRKTRMKRKEKEDGRIDT
jgi:hypothetical protein